VQRYRSRQPHGPAVHAALDAIGYHLGRTLSERFTRDRPPMVEALDVMKWLCKELWTELFGKSVDNLRTNHRGTFVLRDTQFRWTLRLAQNLVAGATRLSPNELAADYLALPCGIIRGTLAALGLTTVVTADATALPQCDFTVVVQSQPNR
jgi:trafficking protein particle complex subunit 6